MNSMVSTKRSDSTNLWRANGISFRNGVPFVTYSFWFGDQVRGKRKEALESFKENIGTPFWLFTQENISDFELANHPFHPAAKYTLENNVGLSGVHLSDYLRHYFSYHFGGAYHDIKPRTKSQSIQVSKLILASTEITKKNSKIRFVRLLLC